MNNSELIKKVSEQAKLSQKDCQHCLEAFKEIIKDALKKGDKVYFSNFGSFKVRVYSPKTILNPQTKRPMIVMQKFIPSFKCGKSFKDSIS